MRSPAAASEAVLDDRACSLSILRAQAGKPLRNVILDIDTHHWSVNEKSAEFLENLLCFLPIKNSNEGKLVESFLRLYLRPHHYVAVSYPWNPSFGENKSCRYQLAGQTVPVRDTVLDRIIRFIRYKQGSRDMIPFWIDQLSIDQRDEAKHEIGMQSMDRVYKQCTYAVGYLWVEVKTQTQIGHLWKLLTGRITKWDFEKQRSILENGVDEQVADEILDMLIQITDDQWWNRAWIFQEDYLAGTKMWLLMRHAKGLDKSYAREMLGDLPGEIVIRSDMFRKHVTLFCLALRQKIGQSSLVSTKCDEILKKAGKYSILHQTKYDVWAIHGKMTVSVLKDLHSRRISFPTDILAITANVCDYENRISVSKEGPASMSLSLSILALCITNGEIIQNGSSEPKPYENVFDYLRNHTLPIIGPLSDGELTFIKHCRLRVTGLSEAGIHTEGMLWRLSDTFHPDCLQQISIPTNQSLKQRDIYRNGLNEYYRVRLSDLVGLLRKRNKRRYQCLADDLASYLKPLKRQKTSDEWPHRFVMDLMAAHVVDAMDSGKYLQVARLVGRSSAEGGTMPYRAIFVREKHEIQRSGPGYIFTSWTSTAENVRNSTTCKRLAKYASIEVDVGKCMEHSSRGLRTKNWANGLCFFLGERNSSFVFPWPESFCD